MYMRIYATQRYRLDPSLFNCGRTALCWIYDYH